MQNEAACLCGNVRWSISAEPFQSYNCHCKMCRKAHGAAYGTYWFVNEDEFQWIGDTKSVVEFESSALFTRNFCGNCGSVVPAVSSKGSSVVVPGGCHDHGKKSDCHIFVAHAAAWHDITDDLPRFDDYPPESGLKRVEVAPQSPGTEGITRGSCLCGAIEFALTERFRVVHNCYCSRCRRARAAAHATNGFTTLDGVRFIKGEEHLRSYKLPDAKFFAQVFCATCGSKMPRLDPSRQVAVTPLGALDDDPGMKAVDHIFADSKAGWHDITGDLPVFSEGPVRTG